MHATRYIRYFINQKIKEGDKWKIYTKRWRASNKVALLSTKVQKDMAILMPLMMQLLKQLHDGGLLVIPNQNDVPNVEFKGRN